MYHDDPDDKSKMKADFIEFCKKRSLNPHSATAIIEWLEERQRVIEDDGR